MLPAARRFSLSGAGFLGAYHLGAASVLRARAAPADAVTCAGAPARALPLSPAAPTCAPACPPRGLTDRRHPRGGRHAGASAGALAAAAWLAGADLAQCRDRVEALVGAIVAARRTRSALCRDRMRSWHAGQLLASQPGPGRLVPGTYLMHALRTMLLEVLPDNAHRRCDGRLVVVVSRISWPFADRSGAGAIRSVRVGAFASRDELVSALLASAFIPVYAGFRGVRLHESRGWFDGGFTANWPEPPCIADVPDAMQPHPITVSPFTGDFDICPPQDPGEPSRYGIFRHGQLCYLTP